MRILWIITIGMVVAGVALAVASVVADFGPIVLIGGVLLLWSGIVKAVVLRVWGAVLPSPPVSEPVRAGVRPGQSLGRQP